MGPKLNVNLTAKWQLDAALLSRPVDLTSLVSMSKNAPIKFTEDNTLERLVNSLLNEKNKNKSDNDTKLDVLNICANVAGTSKEANAVVLNALQQVSEWFDHYIVEEEIEPNAEPELHKAMVLLLARVWEYKLKTEDVLELTQGNRRVALCTVVGLLEDGETYSTELKQKQAPGQGKMGQWEHELVCQRYERPLLLQICRLLRGFTHPGTYFEAKEDGEIELYSVERFADEMDILLDITLRSRLVEKLSVALYDCLFEQEDRTLDEQGDDEDSAPLSLLEESDHMAVVSVHAFLQNLYFYATENNDEFRHHMLVETLLIPRLILPYLDRCVLHAKILNSRAEAYADMLEGDEEVAQMALHNPQLVKGIAASLRTLILASFRAPATQFVMALLRKLNPTSQILRAKAFCRYHEYIFALLCLLNINMGALDLSKGGDSDGEDGGENAFIAHSLLHELATVYGDMPAETQARVHKRVVSSGALPISRDTPSYVAVMSVLNGGSAGQLEYVLGKDGYDREGEAEGNEEDYDATRSEAKQAHAERMASIGSHSSSGSGGAASSAEVAPADEPKSRRQDAKVADDSNSQSDSKGGSNASSSSSSSSVTGEAKGAESKGGSSRAANAPQQKSEGFRLLGDLPSFGGKPSASDVKVAIALELPSEQQKGKNKSGSIAPSRGPSRPTDPDVPEKFVCAINGHVMKDPVRSSTGFYFERATIELWLSTRGSICPISNQPLTADDLEPATDLRNEIKRYHIQKTSMRTAAKHDDDLYDF
jgi:hypothetical protein